MSTSEKSGGGDCILPIGHEGPCSPTQKAAEEAFPINPKTWGLIPCENDYLLRDRKAFIKGYERGVADTEARRIYGDSNKLRRWQMTEAQKAPEVKNCHHTRPFGAKDSCPECATEMKNGKELDHPCKQTCSGWKQGYERGVADTEARTQELEAKGKSLCEQNGALLMEIKRLREILKMGDCRAFDLYSDNGKCLKCEYFAEVESREE